MVYNPQAFVNDYGRGMKPALVRWVAPGWTSGSGVNRAIVANTIYYEPIFVPERTTYDRIGLSVQVGDGAGGEIDLRVFQWAGGLPGALILSAGVVSSNIAGAK